jgi:hypothetical protein
LRSHWCNTGQVDMRIQQLSPIAEIPQHQACA